MRLIWKIPGTDDLVDILLDAGEVLQILPEPVVSILLVLDVPNAKVLKGQTHFRDEGSNTLKRACVTFDAPEGFESGEPCRVGTPAEPMGDHGRACPSRRNTPVLLAPMEVSRHFYTKDRILHVGIALTTPMAIE